MRNRVGVILFLALASGLLAAYLAFTFLREPSLPAAALASDFGTVGVLVAARDMDAGTLIERADVSMVDWPGTALPEGFSTDPSEAIGRGLLTAVSANEPLLASKLALAEAGAGLPILIPEGKRALAVRVDEMIGLAGFTLPGTRVDVIVTLDQAASVGEPATQVVLQNIQVATAGTITERDPTGAPQNVTVVLLLVDPDQAEKLALAQSRGRIQLALRNSLDMEVVETPGIRASQLIMWSQPVPGATRRVGPPRRPSGVTVTVYSGAEKKEETVPRGEGGGQ